MLMRSLLAGGLISSESWGKICHGHKAKVNIVLFFSFFLTQPLFHVVDLRFMLLCTGRPYRGKPSDMWALGVVLFTMLYGQFPFYDSIPQELFRKIKAAEYSIPE